MIDALLTGRRTPPNAGKGRKKGVPNRATSEAREAFATTRVLPPCGDPDGAWLDELDARLPELDLSLLDSVLPDLGETGFFRASRANDSGRCGGRRRSDGQPCEAPPAPGKRRCKWHGGHSTGPRTPEGKAKALANLKQFRR